VIRIAKHVLLPHQLQRQENPHWDSGQRPSRSLLRRVLPLTLSMMCNLSADARASERPSALTANGVTEGPRSSGDDCGSGAKSQTLTLNSIEALALGPLKTKRCVSSALAPGVLLSPPRSAAALARSVDDHSRASAIAQPLLAERLRDCQIDAVTKLEASRGAQRALTCARCCSSGNLGRGAAPGGWQRNGRIGHAGRDSSATDRAQSRA
jgi:hypothetical protein